MRDTIPSMEHSRIKERIRVLFEEIKNNKIKILICIFVVLLIIILSFTIKWNRPAKSSVIRNQLPSITQSGIRTLIIEPDQGPQPVLSLIHNASHSIDLVMYEMTDKDISDALIDAAHRGVSVRVLLNLGYFGKKENAYNDLAYQYLTQHGIQVHWTPGSFALTHQKTLIVDNTQALIMTWNFVPKYYSTGRDFGIIDTDTTDVTAIEQTFSADWNNMQIVPSLGDDLVWSPSSEADMMLLIHNAKKSLDIYNEEINYDQIINALKDAQSRGVIVRIIMTYSTPNKPIFSDLIQHGIGVHTFSGTKKLYIHAKMIVADQDYAYIGSQNFSFNSLNKNRELGIFLYDQGILASLEHTFGIDWNNGKAYVPK